MRKYALTSKEKEKRLVWASVRATLEAFRFKYKRNGKRSKSRWTLFEKLLHVFVILLKIAGLYKKGVDNVKNILVNRITVKNENLPGGFDGFKILHLSDLHIDAIEGFENTVIEKISPLEYDLCVITGDFRKNTSGGYKNIIPAIEKIVKNIKSKEGILATLGNHDSFGMVEPLEKTGMRMLINETVTVERNGGEIHFTGTDDTYYFYTDEALNALEENRSGFKVVLSHTSELYDIAASNGYSLYLCGHTHGGQICLPGGIPVIAHQKEGRRFVKGLWHINGMTGYTSAGVGVSGVPLRYNCPGEIVLITLKKE
jgi:predicted MPP superfamily phosphohydrolase